MSGYLILDTGFAMILRSIQDRVSSIITIARCFQ